MSHPPTGGQRLQDRLFPVPSAFLLLLNWQQERPSPILVGASGLREYWSATAAPFAPYLGCLRPVTSPTRTRLAGPCLHVPRGPPRPFRATDRVPQRLQPRPRRPVAGRPARRRRPTQHRQPPGHCHRSIRLPPLSLKTT